MKIAYKLILGYLLVAALAGFITYAAVDSHNNIDNRTAFGAAGCIFLTALIAGLYLWGSIAKRIAALKEASEQVGAGKLNTEIEITASDEIGELARAFNNMIGGLKENRDEAIAADGRFRAVIESANDAIISTDVKGKILSWNGAATRIFGYDGSEMLGEAISLLFPPVYAKQLQDFAVMCIGSKPSEMKGLKKDMREFPLEISLSSWETAEGKLYAAIIRDVTERRTLEDQLAQQALHDPLTRLANRVLFEDRVEHALEKVARTHDPVSVLYLDIDNFKGVNDTLGQAVGDELLRSVATRLQACLRPNDTAARLSGDEFAVLIEGSERLEGGILVAERIRDIIRAPFIVDGQDVFVSVSIGIATTADGSEGPAELLRNADAAMYMAKNEGRDRYVVFERETPETSLDRVQLEADMQKAIQQNEFEIYYQPIIDLRSRKMIGMEALTRWRHPERGLIAPMEFLPVAEETDLILPLGTWILEEACRQARMWQVECGNDKGDNNFAITVNISSRQFQDGGFIAAVTGALKRSELAAKDLILEVTEATMLVNSENTLKKFYELKELGVQIAIDDFGTGYSSLSYLQRFPIDILKIDKTFIDQLDLDKEGSAVTQAIITMSHSLHLKTIAEGIEHPEQILRLQNLGCELGQGFHFARPLRKGEMGKFLHLAFSSASGSIEPTVSETAASALDRHLALAS